MLLIGTVSSKIKATRLADYGVGSLLWLPSHNGMVLVRLQVQKNTRLVAGALHSIGSKAVP